jgi:predicted MFS family arabinose efflux permease
MAALRTSQWVQAEERGILGTERYYRYYVLVVLTAVSLLSVADRLILSILLGDIKAEFALSDTQLGLLTGFAFTFFYVLFGMPIARFADRSNRKNIIAVAVAAWSLMTALCGAAVGFWSLFLARMGVGVGEAGGTGSGGSIISDYFHRHEMSWAMGILTLGSTLGTAAGLMVGGYFSDLLGWRMAFLALGIPGILLGLIVFFSVKEPKRGRLYAEQAGPDLKLPFVATLRQLARNKVYVRTTLAYGLQIVIGYGFASWMAEIMGRQFEISTGDRGFYLGLAFILGGIPGPLLGGWLADRLAKRNPKWRAWLSTLSVLGCLPIYALSVTSTSFWSFLALFALGYMIYLVMQAPTLALLQLAVPPSQRAFGVSVALVFNNVLGQAIGAFIIGMMSDSLAPTYGPLSLGYAVLTTSIIFGVPAALAYLWTAAAIDRRPAPLPA